MDLCYDISQEVTFYSGESENKMFKKLHYSRSISRIPVYSKDGAICNNSLRLKAVYYKIVTRSFILNAGRVPGGFF